MKIITGYKPLRALVKDKIIGYSSLVVTDIGDCMIVAVETDTQVKTGETITVFDDFASYDFTICVRKDNYYLGILKILYDLRRVIFNKTFDPNTSLKAILDTVSRDLFNVLSDLEILNFVFMGDGRTFLAFCSLQYGLRYYLDKKSITLYKKIDDINVVKHKLFTFGKNLVELNLSIRAYDFLNGNRICKVVHYANKSYSQIMLFKDNSYFSKEI
ncbi:hypothetical protein [Candidatus Borreliella tachyglossi]|uniref:hypothetical protein n=1 Tax=Candidatus Borreliella tachyglossi TaxID=1964448 RepID=UPI00404183EE